MRCARHSPLAKLFSRGAGSVAAVIRKFSWTVCRIRVRSFVVLVKARQSASLQSDQRAAAATTVFAIERGLIEKAQSQEENNAQKN